VDILRAMALPFTDRAEAGRELGQQVKRLALGRPVVGAIPRGGVAVAAPVAHALGSDLDVVVVRKIGAPRQPELGIGAVGPSGDPWLDERLVATLGVERDVLERLISAERAEAGRRVAAYRGSVPPLDVRDRDVVVVDDGIATGGTVIAAARLLRSQEPRRLVLAVPVAPAEGVRRAVEVYDEVVALHTPEPYYAVGQWYRDFHQVDDDEVRRLLAGIPQDR
jgi:putative phosphoribosyl transferase